VSRACIAGAKENDWQSETSNCNGDGRYNYRTQKKGKMANVGIEPKTFALLARRSNQLS
jgi:hypothetical protein